MQVFPEPVGQVIRAVSAVSPRASGSKDAREVVHLGVAVNHLTRDEPGPEEASVLDHIRIVVRNDGTRTWVVSGIARNRLMDELCLTTRL